MTHVRVAVRYPLLVVQTSPRLSVDSVAARAGLHPDVIRRYVALGLLPALHDTAGQPWFVTSDVRRVARIRRMHADLGLNYAALGLVLDLLERIHQLEAPQRPRPGGTVHGPEPTHHTVPGRPSAGTESRDQHGASGGRG